MTVSRGHSSRANLGLMRADTVLLNDVVVGRASLAGLCTSDSQSASIQPVYKLPLRIENLVALCMSVSSRSKFLAATSVRTAPDNM